MTSSKLDASAEGGEAGADEVPGAEFSNFVVLDGFVEPPGPQPATKPTLAHRTTAAGVDQRRERIMGGMLPESGAGDKAEMWNAES